MKKSIKDFEAKNLGNFTKAFGSKIYGGCTTWTIKEVVITKPKSLAMSDSLSSGDGDLTNDGSDGNGPC